MKMKKTNKLTKFKCHRKTINLKKVFQTTKKNNSLNITGEYRDHKDFKKK